MIFIIENRIKTKINNMKKKKNLLDYKKVTLMEYKDQIKLLNEKLPCFKTSLCNKKFDFYPDKDKNYIIPKDEEKVYVFDRKYRSIDALITIITNGEVKKIDMDELQSIDDIRNSSLRYHLDREEMKGIIDIINRDYFDNFLIIKKEKDANGKIYYYVSDGNDEIKIYGYGYEDKLKIEKTGNLLDDRIHREDEEDEYTNIETLDDLADCCEIFGRTDAEKYIARAVERNGWEWKKDDWLCHEISDGKRTLKISVSGECEYDEEGYDENEIDNYGTY